MKSMMKVLFNAAAGVVALLAVASTAQANTTYNLGNLTPTNTTLWYGLVDNSTSFIDTWNFGVSGFDNSPGVVAGGVFFNFGSTTGTQFSSLQLDFTNPNTGTSYSYDLLGVGSGQPVSLGDLANGSYSFTITGAPKAGTATTTYGVSVSTVPVPAAAWLFGTGLIGLVGVARRRRA